MKTAYIIEDEEILRNLLSTFFATTFPEIYDEIVREEAPKRSYPPFCGQ